MGVSSVSVTCAQSVEAEGRRAFFTYCYADMVSHGYSDTFTVQLIMTRNLGLMILRMIPVKQLLAQFFGIYVFATDVECCAQRA